MSDDGADLGVKAEDGMRAAIGGEQPKEQMDPVAFERYIMEQEGPSDYSGTAAYAAKLILLHLRAHPEDTQIPVERPYDTIRDDTGHVVDVKRVEGVRNLTDVMFEDPKFKELDLTGFMWGWAVNAARRCCELEAVPNPAIITVG